MANWGLLKRHGAAAEADRSFAPRMPDVDVHLDLTEVFAKVRAMLSASHPSKELSAGQRCVGIVTPDRTIALLGGPKPGSAPQEFVASAKTLIPFNSALNITAIAFTGTKAPKDTDIKRIPFLAGLLSFAYIGHSVVVFEGHESGFEAALKEADVLIIDSNMLPFIQINWFAVARTALRGKGRIRIYDQATTEILPVVKAKNTAGWAHSAEPDGEASYVNCLLTTLGKRSSVPIELCQDKRLPDLTKLATRADEIEWTSELPFDYDHLNVEEVIRIIVNSPGMKWLPAQEGQVSGNVKMKLVEAGGVARIVSFQLLLTKDGPRGQNLKIERLA
jgi:hypothetical protein